MSSGEPVDMTDDQADGLPSRRTLGLATLAALGIGAALLVFAVLPAEYGVDLTGFGKLTGISRLAPVETDETGGETLAPANTTAQALFRYNISFVPRDSALPVTDGELVEGESATHSFTVSASNITRVTAVLTWTDEAFNGQPTEPDLFELNLTGPSGESRLFLGRNEGANGRLAVDYIVTGLPPSTAVLAADPLEALRLARKLQPEQLDGTGAWTATIRLIEAGGLAGLPLGDTGSSWNLQLFQQSYVPAIGDPVATPIRQDVVELTVPARGQLEFKTRMAEAAEFQYSWTADAELSYDLHGDVSSAQGERVESYETGTANTREGDFKAPFTGRHGWFWQNAGVTDVQLTLRLRGEYVIVGIV